MIMTPEKSIIEGKEPLNDPVPPLGAKEAPDLIFELPQLVSSFP